MIGTEVEGVFSKKQCLTKPQELSVADWHYSVYATISLTVTFICASIYFSKGYLQNSTVWLELSPFSASKNCGCVL